MSKIIVPLTILITVLGIIVAVIYSLKNAVQVDNDICLECCKRCQDYEICSNKGKIIK